MDIILSTGDYYELSIIAACLVGSAFFSASETAITSLGSLRAKHLIEQQGPGVIHLKLWLKYPNRILTTILIFNNIVNILASALATDLSSRHFDNQAIGIATGTITFFVLIFGEIIPKSFAKAHHERLAVWFMRIITIFYYISYPAVIMLSSLASFIVRMLGSTPADTPPITEEELEFLVNVGEKAGVIEMSKKDMLVSIFDIDEIKVREIMTPRTDIASIGVDDSIDDAIDLALETGYSRLPIEHEEDGIDHIVGLLLVKDLLTMARSEKIKTARTIEQLSRKPLFVPEAKPLLEVLKELKRTKNQMAIVVDEHGGTAGIVTLEDIIEEIVGEIQDEYDREEAEIIEIDTGIYDVSGSININDFLEHFDLKPENIIKDLGDFETLAGLIVETVGDLPKVGLTVRIGHLNAEVTEVQRQRIERIRVSKIFSVGEGEDEYAEAIAVSANND